MLKKIKKIPLSVLNGEADALFRKRADQSKPAEVFDIVPEWVPHPGNIQISIQRLKITDEIHRSQFHNRFVLKLHLEGSSYGFVDNHFHNFLPGEGMLIFPFQFHNVLKTPEPDGQLRLLINFTIEEADRFKLEHLRNCTFKFDDKFSVMLNELLRQMHDLTPESRHDTYFAMLRILQALPAMTAHEKAVTPARNERFEEIFTYICRNYRNYTGIKSIAERFGYSEAGIHKLFRRECNRSPASIIHELRLRDAASMLLMTKLSVSEISSRCGFSNAYVFSRAFRKYFNTPPRSFRISGNTAAR